MPQLLQLILRAADYRVLLIIDNVSYPILTGETFDWTTSRESETIYAIGTENPIGEKRNAVKYSGKLSMQHGEMSAILQVAGYTEATQVSGCTIAIASIGGVFSHVWGQVNLNTESVSVKSKSVQTLINIDWNALTMV